MKNTITEQICTYNWLKKRAVTLEKLYDRSLEVVLLHFLGEIRTDILSRKMIYNSRSHNAVMLRFCEDVINKESHV